jgi:L-lactate dehydrogenase (cytochrome)
MRLSDCHNFHDFRKLAKRRLPGPIFDYIDGAADDEVTYRQNTASFERCDLVPNVLRGVETVDMSVTVMGQKLAMPVYCSPTALQRLFHHAGERAVAAAAAKYGTMFGVSSLGTVSLEELRKAHDTPQVYQFYYHRDRGLNRAMMQRAKEAGVEVMMLTVDSITGGNRERDLRTGFSIPFRLTPAGMFQFAIKPMWGINYVTHESFKLPQLDQHVDMSGGTVSIGKYFSEMLDPSMNWNDVAEMVQLWKWAILPEGYYVGGRCQACHSNWLHRHRIIQPWRSAARWFTRRVRPTGGNRGCRGRSNRCDHGRRNSPWNPCIEGAVAWRQGRWSWAVLSLSSRGGRPGRR